MQTECDFLATEVHFADHLRPVYEALLAQGFDVRFHTSVGTLPAKPVIGICAGYGDLTRLRKAGRLAVLLEHGAGQSYSSSHTSYAGGEKRHDVVGFLTPGPYATRSNRTNWPWTPCFEVGCPKLDRWLGHTPPERSKPLVVVSWHWDAPVCPETMSAWPEYRDAVLDIADRGEYDLAIHSHPRIADNVRPWARAHGLRWIETFEEVLAEANVYAVDNSSTLFEFAAVGRPVIALNSKHYRRDVHHGLRFWDEVGIGVHCLTPDQLHISILKAIPDPPAQRDAREASVRRVYGVPIGQATAKAAEAIITMIAEGRIVMSEHRVRAKASMVGYAGEVGPGYEIELFPSHCVVTDHRGRKSTRQYRPNGPCRPEVRAREMVATGLYVPIQVLEKDLAVVESAPTAEVKSAPPARENKMAPLPKENKTEPAVIPIEKPTEATAPIDTMVDEDYEVNEELHTEILNLVEQGYSKSAAVKQMGSMESYTHRQATAAWEYLYEIGAIVDGERMHTYKVGQVQPWVQ